VQNNSALGVEFSPEAYSSSLYFEILKMSRLLWGWYIDNYIINYSWVKQENIVKLKQNGLSVYQTEYRKTTLIALPRLSYIIFNRQVMTKQHCLCCKKS